MFSELLSFCSQGGPQPKSAHARRGGGGSSAKKCSSTASSAKKCSSPTFSAKKWSCLGGGGGSSAKKCSSPTPSAKKCSCLQEEGGIISQNALQVAYISIIHYSLPVISLLTCCQKEALNTCTCLYSQAERHSEILPPPPRA